MVGGNGMTELKEGGVTCNYRRGRKAFRIGGETLYRQELLRPRHYDADNGRRSHGQGTNELHPNRWMDGF